MNTIQINYLRECCSYDPISGLLTWKARPRKHFLSSQGYNIFSDRCEGKEAGNLSVGYLKITIDGKNYLVHRLAYALYHGKFPKGEVDHINHSKTDNRIHNLREVSHHQNMKNATIRADNKSGITGIHWSRHAKKWHAQIQINGAKKQIGYFTEISEAAKARKQAEIKYGFHENHGSNKTQNKLIKSNDSPQVLTCASQGLDN